MIAGFRSEPGRFHDRRDAGRRLAPLLERFRNAHPLVLGLPRGGVPVAREIATALEAPLDLVVARKLGAPGHPEVGIGAVAPGARFLDPDALRFFQVPPTYLEAVESAERGELERRERLYRGGRPAPSLTGRTVILVDDGLATGVTARAAIASARRQDPAAVIFAAPVCAPETAAELRREADAVVCLAEPPGFLAVGEWYEDFRQTTDAEVLACLEAGAAPGAAR